MGVVGFLALMVFGLVHAAAGFLGIQEEFGSAWAWGAIAVALVFRFTLPLTIGAFFGATNVWGWHWIGAALLVAPGLALVVPGVLLLVWSWARSLASRSAMETPKHRRPAATQHLRRDDANRIEPTMRRSNDRAAIQGADARSSETTALDEAERLVGPLIVSGYRDIAKRIGDQCAPTHRTPDQRIIEIYKVVGTVFREVARQRGEDLTAPYLNFIVLKFLQVNESMSVEMFQEHLRYEADFYLRNGLRQDYRKELTLF